MKHLLFFASISFFIIIFIHLLFSAYKISTTTLPDFTIFYGAAKDVVHHVSPYEDKHLFTIFNYPLITAFLFIPFTVLPLIAAQIIWTAANIACIFIIIFLCFKIVGGRQKLPLYLFFVGLFFLFFPTEFTIGMGQVNLIAFVFLFLAIYYLEKNSRLTIPFLFLTILLKPLLAITLVYFFFRGQWKVGLIVGIGCLITFLLTPVVLSLPQPIPSVFSLGGREIYYNQGLVGFISRMTPNLFIREAAALLGILGGLGLLGFFELKKRQNLLTLLSLLLTVLVIVDPLSWQHHFVFLIFPYIYVFSKIQEKTSWWLYILLGISYVLVGWNIKNPQNFQAFPQILLLSHTFYGAILLLALQAIVTMYDRRFPTR